MRGYPKSVEEIIKDVTYPAGVIEAMEKFKQSQPWKGPTEERIMKFQSLIDELSVLYNVNPPHIQAESLTRTYSGSSSYNRGANTITMRGRMSVITLLHEFAHALGKNEYEATKWSVNLFRQVFPEQYSKLVPFEHTLVRVRPYERSQVG